MLESRRASEFTFRAPEWWRDLVLGFLFGVALILVFSDALHWNIFRNRIAPETIFIAIPFALAMLSPRRLLALFVGLCIVLFRCIFLIFLFQNIWSALATIIWLLVLVWLGYAVNRRFKLQEMNIPEDFTAIEFLLLVVGVGGGLYLLYLLRLALGLA